uniref:Lecithin-cholesterol acyltransferase-like 1 n=1 Tax=Steinernema glaseri TaxID=37863 RepID=A0A1I7ZKU3_9BILA
MGRLTAAVPLLSLCLFLSAECLEHSVPPSPQKPYVAREDDPKTPGHPVVLVPGDGGSQIEANLTGKPEVVHYSCYKTTADYFDLWLDLREFAPLAIDCWADNMRLVFDAESGAAADSPGVRTRVPGFGGTASVEWLDKSRAHQGQYFSTIADALVQWGYTRGKDLLGAPFDWRRAPHELAGFYATLRASIETAYFYNGNRRVVVLGHSMGNPVMLYFYRNVVSASWKEKFVHSHISLAGAWGGAMQIVKLFASGYNMDYYRILLSPFALRPMQRSFTSSAFLFPSGAVWAEDEVLAATASKNYTLQNVREFFEDIGYALGWEQFQRTRYPDVAALAAPGVALHCVYGRGVATPETFSWAAGYFPDYQPTATNGDGDGTVNLRSLEACARWNATNNAGRPVSLHALDGADHMSILGDSRTIDLLRNLLYAE